MAITDKRDLLARHYMFCDVDPAVVDRVAALSVTIRLKSGQELFRKGDEGNALYGVLSGGSVGIPHTFLIDRQGVIRFRGHPLLDLTDSMIEALL